MKQKLLASAMALAMVLSLTPVTALAAEGEDTTLPEEEITVQTETPAEEIPVEEPAEPETPAEEPVEPEVPVEEVTETENTITLSGNISGSYTITEPSTIVVQGNAVLTKADGDADNAFTINANTTLEFDSGASLTLSGYTNGFVVSNATLNGGGWVINDGDGMDLFRLTTGGKLNITGDVDLNGNGNTDTTSRAIVLPGSSSGQAVTLAANTTLSANDFYRGVETGGASGYTISGTGMNTSVFDFSDNDCGMFISYFDSNVHFTKCKLEVSNCPTSGIFMRQDNAALDGLYITRVNINCVNPSSLEQEDIAIRFHSNNFTITDSIINIENARNTGLWIFDGWNANEQNEIIGTTITVNNVKNNDDNPVYGPAVRRKAITFVPYRDWLIDDCVITMNGTDGNHLEGGLNIASDIQLIRNGLSFTAKANMFGGTIKLQDTEIYTEYVEGADVGAQIGQFIEIGQNVMIDNDAENEDDHAWTPHYTVLCDNYEYGFPAKVLGMRFDVPYDVTNMDDTEKSPDRVTVVGGSYWSSQDKSLDYRDYGAGVLYQQSIPMNEAGEELAMFTVTEEIYNQYFQDGKITLQNSDGTTYEYVAETPSPDGNRYIWAPEATVTFGEGGETVTVPRGTEFGMFGTMEPGNWVYNGVAFTNDTIIQGDIIVTAQ